jgi:hypothetical protein
MHAAQYSQGFGRGREKRNKKRKREKIQNLMPNPPKSACYTTPSFGFGSLRWNHNWPTPARRYDRYEGIPTATMGLSLLWLASWLAWLIGC